MDSPINIARNISYLAGDAFSIIVFGLIIIGIPLSIIVYISILIHNRLSEKGRHYFEKNLGYISLIIILGLAVYALI